MDAIIGRVDHGVRWRNSMKYRLRRRYDKG